MKRLEYLIIIITTVCMSMVVGFVMGRDYERNTGLDLDREYKAVILQDSIANRWVKHFGEVDTAAEQCARDYVIYGEHWQCMETITPIGGCCSINIDHIRKTVTYLTDLGVDIEEYNSLSEMDELINAMQEYCYHHHQGEY